MMNTSKLAALLALLAASSFASMAYAQSATSQFEVGIEITSVCTFDIASTQNVDFGQQASNLSNIDAAGQIGVVCTQDTPYAIELDNGENGADVDSRAMANGATLVPYQLYRNPARGPADVWGAIAGTVLSGTGSGSLQTLSVYGRVASANFPAAVYDDVVTATVTY